MLDFHLMIAKCPLNQRGGVTLRIGFGHGLRFSVLFISFHDGVKIVQFLRS